MSETEGRADFLHKLSVAVGERWESVDVAVDEWRRSEGNPQASLNERMARAILAFEDAEQRRINKGPQVDTNSVTELAKIRDNLLSVRGHPQYNIGSPTAIDHLLMSLVAVIDAMLPPAYDPSPTKEG